VEIELIVVGEPRPWTVYTKRGAPGVGFERMQAWQEIIMIAAREVMAGGPPMEGAITLNVMFFRVIPKTAPKPRAIGESNKLDRWLDVHIIKRPDRDNYQKAFSDALNGIIYVDDSQITEGSGAKDYAPIGKEGYTWAVIRSND